jgi:hypothetical protein
MFALIHTAEVVGFPAHFCKIYNAIDPSGHLFCSGILSFSSLCDCKDLRTGKWFDKQHGKWPEGSGWE